MAVPGVSGVSKVPAPTVFQAVEMNDKNRNGVIDKLDKYDRPAGEGYTEEADIDLDGKIVKAEAKFYLWYVLDDREKAKQFPITAADRAALAPIFDRAIENAGDLKEPSSVWQRGELVRMITWVGLFKKALKEQRKLELSRYRPLYPSSRSNILAEMFCAGHVEAVLRNIREYRDSSFVYITLSMVADEIPDKNVKEKLFTSAEKEINAHIDQYLRSNSFRELAQEMHQAGTDKSKVERMFIKSRTAARAIKNYIETPYNKWVDNSYKAEALRKLAAAMDEAGEDKTEVEEVFYEALEAIRPVNHPYTQVYYYREIASAMAKAGLDMDKVKEVFRKGLKAMRADKSEMRPYELIGYARDMSDAGIDDKVIRKMFEETGNKYPEN